VEWKGVRYDLLKTGWVDHHCVSNLSLYVDWPTFSITSNGPRHLSPSFLEGLLVQILVASKHTLSPDLNSIASHAHWSCALFTWSEVFFSADWASFLVLSKLSANSPTASFLASPFTSSSLHRCCP
jgi:hypothetical protein